jgi:hypothetical protein
MKKLLIIISLSFLTACGGVGSSSGVPGLNVPGNISMVPSN